MYTSMVDVFPIAGEKDVSQLTGIRYIEKPLLALCRMCRVGSQYEELAPQQILELNWLVSK